MTPGLGQRVATIIWIAYAVFMLFATTAPFQFTTDEQIVLMKISHVSANPFFDPWTDRWVTVSGMVLNVLFFVPFGALGVLANRARPVRATGRRVLFVTVLGLLLSMGIETLQVFTRNRIPSSADVVANAIGALGGSIAGRYYQHRSAASIRRLAPERT